MYGGIKYYFNVINYYEKVNNRLLLDGRWRGIQREDRICKLCNNGIENEIHFLFHCCSLEHIREPY